VHAVVVNVTITDFERARQGLQEQTVPAVSQAPGFVAGYWTRSEDNRGLGLAVSSRRKQRGRSRSECGRRVRRTPTPSRSTTSRCAR
jgi:hypothetical protein